MEPAASTGATVGLGIDVGGTAVKAALVDIDTGELKSQRLRASTPKPATERALTATVSDLVAPLLRHAPSVVGVAFPAAVRRGIVLSAVNIGGDWLYEDLGEVFREALGREVWAINDADAAALAEVKFGAGKHHRGTILVVTLGTGVGTSLVVDGHLVPNIELGCLAVAGKPATKLVSNTARVGKRMGWREWAGYVEQFIDVLNVAVSPDVVILGGGVTADAHKFLPHIRSRPLVLPAKFRNRAGIVGAVLFAEHQRTQRSGGITPTQLFDTTAERGADEPIEPAS